MALEGDAISGCDPSSNSTKARKRRREWQSQQFAEKSDVVIGTLELACDIRTKDAHWTSELIVVDEAAQTTEPMTLIPLQLAAADAHLILIGDHMQLAPTVLSKASKAVIAKCAMRKFACRAC